ncbi:MAG: hypothetical protein COT85_05115 [Chlamydiae bacterium CG10_big_fil_rev_8_21_14_0_10_42_34]|nr:MAG: hypothetical protein COT85_05115 [Chlamydiae bacterium CG10_big_fil_rev_8_21_14_0_10_42_34]
MASSVYRVNPEQLQAQLFDCARNDNRKAIQVLVKNGVDINAVFNYGEKLRGLTALHVAAFEGHVACVEILLNYGANIHAKDSHKNKPIDIAFERHNFEVKKGAAKSSSVKFYEIVKILDVAMQKFEELRDQSFCALDLAIGERSRGRYQRLIDLRLDYPRTPESSDSF